MHQRSTSALFRDVRPKLFIVLSKGASEHWVGHLPKWLPALHAQFASRLRFVLVNPSSAADFLRAFGLSASDAPTLVIHQTAGGAAGGEAKYRYRGGAPLRKAAVWRFVQGFFYGQLEKEEL